MATVSDRPSRAGLETPLAEGNADARDTVHAEPPSLAGSSATSAVGSAAATLYSSPQAALDHSEISRTRSFITIGILIAIAAVFLVPLLPGGRITTRAFLTGIGVAVVGLSYLLYRARKPETYQRGFTLWVGWIIPVIAVTTAVPFFGAFSPVPILLVLGIFFNGLGSNLPVALSTYIACALAQGVTSGLVIAGVMDEPGFIYATYLTTPVQIICQVLVQIILLATFLVARASRRSSLAALSELEKAVRAVAQREALLEEARDELRRALGSGRGRFTDQLIGTFQLGDVIGRGAMGEVYQGKDTRDDEPVAVKMLSHASLGNPHHVQRFLRELQTAAAISSPHVVRVLAVGENPLPHLVMERLRGRDLAAILRARRTLVPERVVEMLRQVGAGITAAADVGVIHRDLKPHNLFLVGSTWKILDFGVSRVAAASDTLTGGQVVGTPAYMAPEQARGGRVDHRTDLYALAAVAYRALTGHSLFPSGEIADMLYRVVHTAPNRPSSRIELPHDVDLALAIGLAKDPAARFASAAELADAIELALASKLPQPLRVRGFDLERAGAWAS